MKGSMPYCIFRLCSVMLCTNDHCAIFVGGRSNFAQNLALRFQLTCITFASRPKKLCSFCSRMARLPCNIRVKHKNRYAQSIQDLRKHLYRNFQLDRTFGTMFFEKVGRTNGRTDIQPLEVILCPSGIEKRPIRPILSE